ncbi:MAG: hypothetical protein K2Q26_10235 [Bdellovibrionales bacterium]|nr:hypothetical protein [Bdellovibrionales bacterium]
MLLVVILSFTALTFQNCGNFKTHSPSLVSQGQSQDSVSTLMHSSAVSRFNVSAFVSTASLNSEDSPQGSQYANVVFGGLTEGSGHIGVDIAWDKGDSLYNPCHHSDDIYYGACIMSSVGPVSYYKVLIFSNGSNNFPSGIFIDSENNNYCSGQSWCKTSGPVVPHNWQNLLSYVALEIYPYGSSGGYDPRTNSHGGLRVSVNSFPQRSGSGKHSVDLGKIALPQMGHPQVGKLNGFVRSQGQAVAAERMNIDAFQTGLSTYLSSTGYPFYGFSSSPTNQDGYYTTGPVPQGTYKTYLTDNRTGKKNSGLSQYWCG